MGASGRREVHVVAAAAGAEDSSTGRSVIPVTTEAVPQMSYAEFQRWKQQKAAEAAAKAAEAARKRAEDIAAGRVRLNGRELYQVEPWVFDDSRFE